ncbi:hypothetical protein D6850_10215 [Roseovarius spongiae]|uniref:Pilus assembly protein PilP n=1 Tax=Roseovarius spongiae TaxID=2320272 RepID=A0A3A8B3F8_9RHOB|nr:hypothetical protein [Roseovarius spongiae]RKF15202.1 hypothetical protein D6850_10215 [Roseovarius spongiae]
MTDFSDTTETPANTERAATQEAALPRGIVLVGTVTGQNSARALIRLSDGEVVRVGPGDQVGGRTVAAIDQGRMILMKNGRTASMVIPGV